MGPAGASMRAGLEGLKIAEKRRLLPVDQPSAAKNSEK